MINQHFIRSNLMAKPSRTDRGDQRHAAGRRSAWELFALLAASLLSACSGGSSSTSGSATSPQNCVTSSEVVPFARVISHTHEYINCPVTTEAAFALAGQCVAIQANAGEECFMFSPPNAAVPGAMPGGMACAVGSRTVIVPTKLADPLYSARPCAVYRMTGTTRISNVTPAADAFIASAIEPVVEQAPAANSEPVAPSAAPQQ